MAFLNKGLKIRLIDERHVQVDDDNVQIDEDEEAEAKPREATYLYEHGLLDYVQYLNSAKKVALINPHILVFEAEEAGHTLSRTARPSTPTPTSSTRMRAAPMRRASARP